MTYGHWISTCYSTKACSINSHICAGTSVSEVFSNVDLLSLWSSEGGVKHGEQ